jgi:pre-mRNA-splicing factor CWC26
MSHLKAYLVTLQEGTRAAIKEESPPPAADKQPQVVEIPFVGGLVSAAQLKKVLPLMP